MHDDIQSVFQICRSWDVAVTVADPSENDCPLIFANESFEALTGYSESEVIGKNCRFLQGEATERSEVDQLRQEISLRQSAIACFANYTKSGEVFNNLLFIEPIRLLGGQEVLIGCQYNFGLRDGEENALGIASSFDQHAEDLQQLQRETLRMRIMTFQDRSTATLQRIGAYIALTRIRNRTKTLHR